MLLSLKIVYSSKWLVTHVYEVSERKRNKITDTARLEDLIFRRLARYVKDDIDRLSHTRILRKLVGEVASQVEREYRNEEYEVFSALTTESDGDDREIEFDPADVLTDVTSDMIAKEMIDLLTQADHRTKEILEHWTHGIDNLAMISRLLTQTNGGKPETHRRYITRFRDDCRKRVLLAI